MYQQFQQPFTSIPQTQLTHYGLGGALGQYPSSLPYGQPYLQPSPFAPQPIGALGQTFGQPFQFGYPYGQQQQFIPPTLNPLEVVNVVARILPLLLQSSVLMPQGGHIPTVGMPLQTGSAFGQHPYALLHSGLFQNPIGGWGSFGSPWGGSPFAHY
jgi:hypothetical protein